METPTGPLQLDTLSNPVHPRDGEVEEDFIVEGNPENGSFEPSHNSRESSAQASETSPV